MKFDLVSFLLSLVILPIVDAPWLILNTYIGIPMFEKIQGAPVKLQILPAIVVYVALALLLIQQTSALNAAITGSLVYAVYDFTNLATLKDYKLSFAIQDTTWGGILFGISYFLLDKIHKAF
uniref:DUF2177 family protein n=1 Tax=viral metagenome TaxID=1070528 RepID=A0A6C0KQ57_9ZZZZ